MKPINSRVQKPLLYKSCAFAILFIAANIICHNSFSQNLLQNGGFECGGKGVGFNINSSAYTNILVLPRASSNPGDYAVTNDSYNLNTGAFIHSTDHSGTGNMLVCDGITTGGGQIFWQAGSSGGGICGLTVGTTYTFSYWVKSISTTCIDAATCANLSVKFNNTGVQWPAPVSGSQQVGLPAAGWQQVTYTFVPTNACVNIEIVNNNTNAVGNDFALDDMSVTGPPTILKLNINDTVPPTCIDGLNGAIYLSASGGKTPYTFNLSGTVTASNNSGNFTGLPAGTYTVSVTDATPTTLTHPTTIKLGHAEDSLKVSGDTTICSGGNAPLLVSGGYPATYTWTPNDGTLSAVNIPNPVASPTTNATYTVTSQQTFTTSSSTNLISNPAFTNGNSGFYSEYSYLATNPSGTQKTYGIVSSPNTFYPAFSACGDHTSGTGNMMVIDGSIYSCGTTLADKVWSQSVSVVPGNTYTFSYWIQTIAMPNPAIIEVRINGVSLGTTTAPNTAACGNWTQVSYSWASGIANTAQITLYDNNVNAGGNDFALDDFSFTSNSITNTTCTLSKTVVVNVNPGGVPVTGFTYPTPVCINGTNPAPTTVAGFTTGGVFSATPSGLSINPGTGAVNLAASTPNTYMVSYTFAASGCNPLGTSNFSLTIAPLPLAPGINITQPTCTVPTGSVTITGIGGETYSFDGSGYSSTLIYSGLAAGSSHTVYAKNAAGCISPVTNITINAQPATPAAPNVTVTQPTCTVSTGTVTISGNIGETYSFDGSAYAATLVYSGLAAGSNHTVFAKNAAGCISAVTNVAINAQPATPAAPAVTITQPTCTVSTGTVTITGNIGETYSFDGGVYAVTLIYSGLAAGSNHTVFTKNAAGCISAVTNVAINAQPATPAAPTVTITQPTCTVSTGTATITGNIGETYSFDGSLYTATLVYSGLTAGSNHTVFTKNSAGCISPVTNITINAQPATPAAPTVTLTQPTCTVSTGTATITGNIGITYSFDGSAYAATLVYSGLAAGSNHTVFAKNAAGCISSVTNVAINAQPATPAAPTVTITQPTCTVSTGTATITGNIGITYSFDGSAYAATLVYSGLAAGSNHTVFAKNAAGCISLVTNITFNAQPATPNAPAVTLTQPTCTVSTGTATITGNIGETYSFDGSPYVATLIYSSLAAGSNHTVFAKNAAGCISTVTNISINAQPSTPAAPTVTITQPTCTVSTGAVTITGNLGETYSFDGSAYAATLVYSGLAAGSNHTVFAKNAAGCISPVTNFTINAQPVTPTAPTVTITQPTCTVSTGTATISGNIGETYSFDGSAYTATLVYSGLAAGSNHTVFVKNAAGCISPVTNISINIQPATPAAPAVTITQPTCTISTGSATISGNIGETYSFDGNAYAGTLVYSGLAAGSNHTVFAKNAAGCISPVTNISINIQPATPAAPTVTITQPTCTVSAGTATITGSLGETYSFDGSIYSATLVYGGLASGSNHTVFAKNAAGCISLVTNISINTQPATPGAPTVAVTQPTCTISTGTATITGNIGITYSFDGSAYAATLVYSGLAAGSNHTVFAKNAAGCISPVTNITINAQPVTPAAPAVTITQPTCTVSTATVTITGNIGETYSFDGSIYSATLVYGGLAASSNHTVFAKNSAGCISPVTNITINAQPATPTAPTVTLIQPSCTLSTGTATITGNPGETYSFDGSTYAATLVYSGLAAGSNHTVFAKNAAGCISTVTNISINVQPATPTAPAVTLTQPTCTVSTGTATISGNIGETYSFDGSAYTATLFYSGLAAGSNHTVFAKNAAGCISPVTNITINAQPATPAAPTVTLTQPTCTVSTGTANITGNIGETYSFDGSTYASTLVYSGLAAGSNHTVFAKNAAGCISPVTNININAQPLTPAAPTVTVTQPTCTVSTGTATISGNAGETYSFDGSAYAATLIYSGLAAGSNHTIFAKNAAGCISTVTTISINAQPASPAAPAVIVTQPTCTVSTGTATISGNIGENYSFDGSVYSSTLVYSSLAANSNHTVFAKNAAGCISPVTNITINAQPLTPAAPTVTITQPTCTLSTGTATISGNTGETYSFDGSVYSATLIYNGLAASSAHTVFAKNTAGCISPVTNITINAQPATPAAPTVTVTQPTCLVSTGAATISGNAGETYSFDGSVYSALLIYNGLAASSSHTVFAKNTAGCVSTVTNITINTQPATPAAPTITITQPTCTISTGTATISGNAGETYSFDGSVYSATLIYNGLAASSSHTVFAKNTTGCISSVTNITINAQPITPAAPTLTVTQPTCLVSTGTATISGNAGETYSFDGSVYSATLIYNGLAASSAHTVFAKNTAGCISPVTNININAQPATPSAPVVTVNQPTCLISSGIATITGNVGETYSFDGSIFSATLIYSGLAASSNHTVFAKNAAGCISPVTNIVINAQPLTPAAPVVTLTQPTCTISTGTATITASIGETYSFDGSVYSSTLVYSSLPAGSAHIVFAKNTAGCISTVTNIVFNLQPATPAPPVVTITQPICSISTGSVTITGIAGETYSFDGGINTGTLVYSGLAANTNHTVYAINAAGCKSAFTNISINAQPVTPAAPAVTITQPTCSVATGSISITSVIGNTYSFDGSAYSGTLMYGNLLAGSAHTLFAKNISGCISPVTNITINAQPAIPLAPVVNPDTVNYCQQAPANPLSAIGSNLLWYTNSIGGTGVGAVTPSTSTPGTVIYYVSQTVNGCESPRSPLTIITAPFPNLGADKTAKACFGQTVNLNGLYNTSGLNYTWYLAGVPVAPVDSIRISRTYQLIVSNTAGCKDSASVIVTILPPVIAYAGADTTAQINTPTQLHASGAGNNGTYLWSTIPAASNAVISNPASANPLVTLRDFEYVFEVLATNELGCSDRDTMKVKVLAGPSIYVPSAFTPGGLNSIFKPIPVGYGTLDYFRVYNRYGEQIYETNKWFAGWDGTYKGQQQPLGTYVWVLQARNGGGTPIQMKGTVILVR